MPRAKRALSEASPAEVNAMPASKMVKMSTATKNVSEGGKNASVDQIMSLNEAMIKDWDKAKDNNGQPGRSSLKVAAEIEEEMAQSSKSKGKKKGNKTKANSNRKASASSASSLETVDLTKEVGAEATETPKPKKNTKPKWLATCAPRWTVDSEHDNAEDNETDEDEEDDNSNKKQTKCCVCADENILDKKPDWPYVTSGGGLDLRAKWLDQMDRRIPDFHGVYFYNDFANYGFAEVVENIFVALDKEFKREQNRPMYLWHHLEGLALFLAYDSSYLMMTDDGDRSREIVKVVGAAVNTSIERLGEQGKLSKKTTIRNVNFIYMQFIEWARSMEDLDVTWHHRTVKLLQAIPDTAFDLSKMKDAEKIAAEAEEDDEDDDDHNDDDIDWDDAIEDYIEQYQPEFIPIIGRHELIGGTKFDITKMPKQVIEEEKHRFDEFL